MCFETIQCCAISAGKYHLAPKEYNLAPELASETSDLALIWICHTMLDILAFEPTSSLPETDFSDPFPASNLNVSVNAWSGASTSALKLSQHLTLVSKHVLINLQLVQTFMRLLNDAMWPQLGHHYL